MTNPLDRICTTDRGPCSGAQEPPRFAIGRAAASSRQIRIVRHLVLVVVGVTLILAGCGDDSTDAALETPDPSGVSSSQPPGAREPSTSIESVPITGSAAEEPAVTPHAGGVPGRGQAVNKSDVSGLTDSVLSSGEVLFVPEDRATDLAGTAGFDPSDIDGMRHAFFELDESRLAELAGGAAAIGSDGSFPLDLPAGRYLVCLADTFVDHTSGPPYAVVGCDVIDLSTGASLTVSFGEGGVEATLD